MTKAIWDQIITDLKWQVKEYEPLKDFELESDTITLYFRKVSGSSVKAALGTKGIEAGRSAPRSSLQ